jgi:hypothetical protein
MDTDAVFEIIRSCLVKHLSDSGLSAGAADSVKRLLPQGHVENIDKVLRSPSVSYRDALIIQLAYGIESEEKIDLTRRHPGARGVNGVAGRVAKLLSESHVHSIKDAYQNIGKNTENLVRGNFPEFDSFLRWASAEETKKDQLTAALEYACAEVASTARPIDPMPLIDASKLTFAAVTSLFEEMFCMRTHGAFEQFTVAALLHAQTEASGNSGLRVETKSLNASDKSSRVAGDIQIMTGTRIVEAYEVTANEWESKIGSAGQTIRENDLSRLHIVAQMGGGSKDEMIERLMSLRDDISVLDLAGFTSTLLAGLTRQYRVVALTRLYEFLDRYQPDPMKVNDYVRLLEKHRLTQSSV